MSATGLELELMPLLDNARSQDYFSYLERAIPQIYFCHLQVRLRSEQDVRPSAVRLG